LGADGTAGNQYTLVFQKKQNIQKIAKIPVIDLKFLDIGSEDTSFGTTVNSQEN
jgi:hypothetical protein